jgi:formate hydrogenlyase subunit 3/multisubunit Na+/H+ antiporter MnhD subunit
MEVKNKKKRNKHAVISILLFVMFILLPISGKMISATKADAEIAYIWGEIHYLTSLIFTIVGIFHIVYNWKSLKNSLTKK